MSEIAQTDNFNDTTIIKVVGVGGAGGNAVNRMIAEGLQNVEFVAINTDAKDLLRSDADVKISLSDASSRGLGAGADPEKGAKAAQDHQSVNSAGKVQLHQCYSGTRPAGDSAHLQVQPHRRSGTDRRRDAQRLLQVSGGDEQHGRQKRCSQQGENDRRHRDHPLLAF